jgi:hypothetical protein
MRVRNKGPPKRSAVIEWMVRAEQRNLSVGETRCKGIRQ